MTGLNQNFRDLLASLNSAGVRYLLVGGYAVNYYGYHRNTKDFDVWIATDAENAGRVVEALKAFGFSARSVRSSMFQSLGKIYTFGREPFRVDILTQPTGVEFEPCYERRVEANMDGVRAPVISLKDLLINKAASGRPKDAADVEKLNKKPPALKPRRRLPKRPRKEL